MGCWRRLRPSMRGCERDRSDGIGIDVFCGSLYCEDGGIVVEICKTTSLECRYCMPGPCEHRQTVISKDDRQLILRRNIARYGPAYQVERAIEEMAELMQALLRARRPERSDLQNVREEIVDVQIVLDQLKLIFGWDKEIETAKLARLQRRIRDAQESRSAD